MILILINKQHEIHNKLQLIRSDSLTEVRTTFTSRTGKAAKLYTQQVSEIIHHSDNYKNKYKKRYMADRDLESQCLT